MKQITLLAFFVFASILTYAQTSIELKDAGKHAGDSVTLCGKVFTTRFFTRDTLTLLNMGAAYPNQQLTLVIHGPARSAFKEAPEIFYKDREVCVSGRISMYNDKPQIVIYRPEQVMEAIKKQP